MQFKYLIYNSFHLVYLEYLPLIKRGLKNMIIIHCCIFFLHGRRIYWNERVDILFQP